VLLLNPETALPLNPETALHYSARKPHYTTHPGSHIITQARTPHYYSARKPHCLLTTHSVQPGSRITTHSGVLFPILFFNKVYCYVQDGVVPAPELGIGGWGSEIGIRTAAEPGSRTSAGPGSRTSADCGDRVSAVCGSRASAVCGDRRSAGRRKPHI
jgi:hypothetical protein